MRIAAPLCLIAGALLAGCAHMGGAPKTPPRPCFAGPGAICVVKVSLTNCNDLNADPERAKVAPGQRGDVEWQLVTSGWEFTTNGIVFKDPANGEFDNKRPGKQGFKYNNKHQGSGEHEYTIEVTNGRQVCRKDPSIMN